MKRMTRVALITSGGDCQGLNAAIRGVGKALFEKLGSNVEVFGMYAGYRGLADGDYKFMEPKDFSGILTLGGTILGTRRTPFRNMRVVSEDGVDKVKAMKANYKKMKLDCLVTLGGNGTHKTANLLSEEGLNVIGLPKTIDNDLFGTDHCPGYASAAKYIATSCMEVSKDCRVYDNGTITVIEIMGRHAGWLAGSAALATYCGSGPDLVYLPEVDFDMERFFADVHRVYEQKNSVLIAVSEGIHYADGSFVSEAKASATDGFGHAQLGGLAARLAQALKEREHAKVRGIELSLLQRAGAHLASQTDIDEAFAAGKTAVEAAIAGETGKMVALMREIVDGKYTCRMELIPLADVANYEKKVPVEWIVPEGNNVTQDFIDYALPLIQGVPEIPVENGLPRYARLKKVLAK